MSERILLHTCCAPCSTVPIPSLKDEGFDVEIFFFNPNIHPYTEFLNRLNSMQQLAQDERVPGFFYRGYPLESFLRMQLSRFESRCSACYELRLGATAARAKELGIRFFSTTLLISPYQKHEIIANVGRGLQERTRIEFLYRDWRPEWRESRERARKKGLYLQKYCGCIFSEAERNLERQKKRLIP